MKKTTFFYTSLSLSIIVILFIVLPLFNIIIAPSLKDILEALKDEQIINSLTLSLSSAFAAAIISLLLGTPLAYILARKEFPLKKLIEGIIDLPLMIPHPVIGLAILSIVAKDHFIGKILNKLAIEVIGSVTGIIIVLTYVGLPFYINTVKTGFKAVPERLEHVSRTLGKTQFQTFIRITLPLTYRSIIEGIIMATARAISEFGAVIIIAYHPMIAPVLIYERFTSYGLKYSAPVSVLLILISLFLFVLLRVISTKKDSRFK